MSASFVATRFFGERTENFLDVHDMRLNDPPKVQREELQYQGN